MKRKHCRRMAALFAAVMLLSAFPAAAEQAYTTYTSEALRLSFQVDAGYSVTERDGYIWVYPGETASNFRLTWAEEGDVNKEDFFAQTGEALRAAMGGSMVYDPGTQSQPMDMRGIPMDAMMYAYTDAQSGQIIEGAYLWEQREGYSILYGAAYIPAEADAVLSGLVLASQTFSPVAEGAQEKVPEGGALSEWTAALYQDCMEIAQATAGAVGADLANLLNEGALLAARRGKAAISQQDLETSMIKVIAGPEKKSRVVSHAEKMLTAVHEAGHAICMYCLDSQDPVHLITIIPRAQAGGMTISLPQDDRSYSSRNEMFETIVSFLGGRVAEAQKLCDISTGASNDLQRATGIARDMVAKYGMSDSIGPVSYAGGQEVFIGRDYEKTKPYSEQTAGQIDAQVQKIMREAYQRCEQILRDHAERLDKIASFLMENENMSRAQFEAVMQDETLDQPKA